MSARTPNGTPSPISASDHEQGQDRRGNGDLGRRDVDLGELEVLLEARPEPGSLERTLGADEHARAERALPLPIAAAHRQRHELGQPLAKRSAARADEGDDREHDE
jgi:hypothetical protein